MNIKIPLDCDECHKCEEPWPVTNSISQSKEISRERAGSIGSTTYRFTTVNN